MSANEAILDRRLTGSAEPGRVPARAVLSGPWLQVGSIQRLEWNRFELPIESLPPALEGLRIVQLSDLHLRSAWHPGLDEVLERVQADQPDLILITGDFVEDKWDPAPALPLVERFVKGLRSRCGIFAISGNHDSELLLPRVAGWGATILTLAMRTVMVRGTPVELIGLAGLMRRDLETQHLLDVPPPDARGGRRVPRFVLSHYPDSIRAFQSFNGDPALFFAGHTHGGQVCLPGGFPILRHDTLPRRYCRGAHRVGSTWLIVSRGMGFSSYPIRVFCPAEVVEVVLKAKG